MDFELVQQQTKCNYCRNPMIMSEPISDANFIEIKGKYLNNGEKATALYCSGCLAVEQRTQQPNLAINKETLEEFNIEQLYDEPPEKVTKEKLELETENH